jgi:O-antigen/teichoic acid export membrane protein
MSLQQRWATWRSSAFVRSVGVLVGGTAMAHGITAAAMPIVTRLYTPAHFGLLAVFSAVLAVVAVAVCLRYEIAIAIPESDEDAANLVALAAACAVLVSSLLGLLAVFAAAPISAWLGQPALAPYLWLLPVCTGVAGVYAALQFWFVRHKQFAVLARTRVAQSAAASGTQIGMGMAGLAPLGLVLGQVINSGAGFVGVLHRIVRQDREVLRSLRWRRMWALAKRYDRFPKYSATEALANSASIQVPVMMIAAMGSGAEAGHLMLAMFVVQAPVALVGGAVSQVYLSNAPDALREGRLAMLTADVIGGLLRSGAGPLLFLGVVSPQVFPFIFGPQWDRAGAIVAWLTPWFIAHFVTAPISMALHVTGQQRLAFVLQAGGLAFRVAAVGVASALPHALLVESYAVSGLVFYTLYLALVVRAVSTRAADVARAARAALPACLAWLAAAIGVLVATRIAAAI